MQRPGAAQVRQALQIEEIHALIAAAAQKHGVPTALVKSIVATESNFRCNVVSARGAIGLMQLTPATARQYGANASVPHQNIDAGTRYLRFLIDKYRGSTNQLKYAIAAYNAGSVPSIDTRVYRRFRKHRHTCNESWRACKPFKASFDRPKNIMWDGFARSNT